MLNGWDFITEFIIYNIQFHNPQVMSYYADVQTDYN